MRPSAGRGWLKGRASALFIFLLAVSVLVSPARGDVWTALDGSSIDVERGIFEVPEVRGDDDTRRLRLPYVVLPATTGRPGPPIVYIAGGPGASGIESAKGPRAQVLSALRQVADVVLFDQRGTGGARPSIVCGESWRFAGDEVVTVGAARAKMVAAARACAESAAERGVPLDAYDLESSVDDIDALRRHLGADRVSVVASSFGTRLALELLRRHGESVHRVALLGVVGPDHVLKLPRSADDVLDALPVDAERSLADVLDQAMAGLAVAPAPVRTEDPLTGEVVELLVSPFDLRLAVVGHLEAAARLDQLAAAAVDLEAGRFEPLADEIRRQRHSWLGHAAPYVITCSAGSSGARLQSIARQAPDSLVGDLFDFAYPAICEALGIEPLGDHVLQPVVSDVPVLLVSGSLDSRTPVDNARQVGAHLARSGELVIEGAGHGDDLWISSPEIGRRLVAFFAGEGPRDDRIVALRPWQRPPPPPTSEIHPVREVLHDVELTDPYRWLEADDTPETRLWTARQNRYTDRVLEVLPTWPALRRETAERLAGSGVSRPRAQGETLVYLRRLDGSVSPSVVVRRGPDGAERVLVDPARWDASDAGPASVEMLDFGADGDTVAYGLRRRGAEEIEVRFVGLSGRHLEDTLPLGRYFGVSVAPDGRGVYYARELDSGEGARVYYHRFGDDPARDREIFGDGYGRGSVVWANPSDDGRYLVLHGVSGNSNRIDVYLDRLDRPAPDATGADGSSTGHDLSSRREVVAGLDAAFYGGVLGDRLILQTTWLAPRGRVLSVPLDAVGREQWTEIVPQPDEGVIETVFGAGDRLIVERVVEGISHLDTYDLDGRSLGEISLPAPGTVSGLSGRWNEPDLYLTLSSFVLPPTTYRVDLETGALEPWAGGGRGGLDPAQVTVRRLEVPSGDVRVPLYLVHRRGLELDGSHATLVTAYGGFGTSLGPAYDPLAALWVERGGVWAVAAVRGGGELGAEWHRAALRENKQRSIDDLVATLEWLIDNDYTRPERLALLGHSAGGLLVAATMVQRPELMRAVVSTHPLLDMLRYNRFLAARFWIVEYGSPDRADAFAYLHAYSPYHRVEDGVRYPAVFLMTSSGDTQVAPLHARKMTARLQRQAGPDRPVLLRHYRDVGHGGEGVTADHRSRELTDVLSFLSWQLGGL